MATITSTDETYKNIIKENKLVLFDMFATWCAPCKAISIILEELSKNFEGKLKVAKHDIDSDPNFPTLMGVRGVPTLFLYKDSQLVETKVGLTNKSDLISLIKEHLS